MKKIIHKILTILQRKEKNRLLGLLAGSVIISVLDITFIALLLFIINFYTQPQRLLSAGSQLPGWLLVKDSVLPVSIFFFLFALKNVAAYVVLSAQNKFVFTVAHRIASVNMLNYLEGNYSDYTLIDSSVQMRKIGQQPIEFAQYILAGSQQMVTELILILLSFAAIIWFDPKLFLLLFALLLPAVVLLSFITKRKLKSVRNNVKNTSEKALQYLQESLSGFVESNIYDKNSFFTGRYSGQQKKLNDQLAALQTVQAIPSRLVEVFAIFGLFILITINKIMPATVYTTALVTIGAFMAAAYKIIPGVVKIANLSGQVRTYEFVLDDLLKEKIVTGRPSKNLLAEKIEAITFDAVDFKYNGITILENFNATLSSGDFLGISGASGKGKTTVVNLLLGFLTPCQGQILINGKVCPAICNNKYWNQIAYVKQQTFLLHDSIVNNIVLGDINYDQIKLAEVLHICGLHKLMGKSKEGLTRIISENGKNISGGQRQRIAIARALYKDADVVILDEPFNELDEASEHTLLKYFAQLQQNGKIILLITHNKKALSFCNKIVSLDEKTFQHQTE